MSNYIVSIIENYCGGFIAFKTGNHLLFMAEHLDPDIYHYLFNIDDYIVYQDPNFNLDSFKELAIENIIDYEIEFFNYENITEFMEGSREEIEEALDNVKRHNVIFFLSKGPTYFTRVFGEIEGRNGFTWFSGIECIHKNCSYEKIDYMEDYLDSLDDESIEHLINKNCILTKNQLYCKAFKGLGLDWNDKNIRKYFKVNFIQNNEFLTGSFLDYRDENYEEFEYDINDDVLTLKRNPLKNKRRDRKVNSNYFKEYLDQM